MTDDEAVEALQAADRRPRASSRRSRAAHAIAYAMQLAPTLRRDQIIVVNLSGRGDKDMNTVADVPRASTL